MNKKFCKDAQKLCFDRKRDNAIRHIRKYYKRSGRRVLKTIAFTIITLIAVCVIFGIMIFFARKTRVSMQQKKIDERLDLVHANIDLTSDATYKYSSDDDGL